MNRTNNTYTETKNSLPQSIRFRSVGLLNRNLASAIDLERQAKQAHWNVKGSNFIALHELFDKVAEGPKNSAICSPSGSRRWAAAPRAGFKR
jgi:DNA-binding ferritin-like protein